MKTKYNNNKKEKQKKKISSFFSDFLSKTDFLASILNYEYNFTSLIQEHDKIFLYANKSIYFNLENQTASWSVKFTRLHFCELDDI